MRKVDHQKTVSAQISVFGVQQQLQSRAGIQALGLPQWALHLISWLAYFHNVINLPFSVQ